MGDRVKEVMDIHVRLNGEIIDLHAFSDDEYAFYQRCLRAFYDVTPYNQFLLLIQDPQSILLKKHSMKEAYQSSLGKAVMDLGDRLALKQGVKQPTTNFIDENPVQEETFVTAREAARIKGMSATAIMVACEKGKLAAHKESGKRGRWQISKQSLEKYQIDKTRQQNRMKYKE